MRITGSHPILVLQSILDYYTNSFVAVADSCGYDMSESAFPSPDADVESVTPDELYERIDAGDAVTLLDVRATDEYEKWHIDGENVESINVPYFEYLADDPDDELFDPVPEDEEVTVLCAKGGSSEYIAGLFAERNYDVNHLEDGMKGWARVLQRTKSRTRARTRRSSSTNGRPAVVCPTSWSPATRPPSSTRFGRSRTST